MSVALMEGGEVESGVEFVYREIQTPEIQALLLARALNLCFGNEEEARDLVQRTCVRVCDRAHQFKGGSLRRWAFTIMKNIKCTLLRRAGYVDFVDFDDWKDYGVALPDVDEMILYQEVQTIISGLGGRASVVMEWIFRNDGGYEVCAEQLGIPVGTVKSALSRAKQKLKGVLKKDEVF